ncbi:hypothetical protein SMICM304S_06558 [Streptomyces microflavus]
MRVTIADVARGPARGPTVSHLRCNTKGEVDRVRRRPRS